MSSSKDLEQFRVGEPNREVANQRGDFMRKRAEYYRTFAQGLTDPNTSDSLFSGYGYNFELAKFLKEAIGPWGESLSVERTSFQSYGTPVDMVTVTGNKAQVLLFTTIMMTLGAHLGNLGYTESQIYTISTAKQEAQGLLDLRKKILLNEVAFAKQAVYGQVQQPARRVQQRG